MTGCHPLSQSHSHNHSHATDNLAMSISLQSMSLEWRRKLASLEGTPKAGREHANSTHTGQKQDTTTIKAATQLTYTDNIIKDTTYPAHHLFNLLPSAARFRRIAVQTSRLKSYFFFREVSPYKLSHISQQYFTMTVTHRSLTAAIETTDHINTFDVYNK